MSNRAPMTQEHKDKMVATRLRNQEAKNAGLPKPAPLKPIQVALKPGQKLPKKEGTKGNYINNKDLLEAIAACKANGNKLDNKLGGMLMLMCERYSYRRNWCSYSYRADMASFALLNLVNNWYKFNEEKYDNPFAFYTTAIYRSFLQYAAEERKQRDIRDEYLVDAGANPSWNYKGSGVVKSSGESSFDSDSTDGLKPDEFA